MKSILVFIFSIFTLFSQTIYDRPERLTASSLSPAYSPEPLKSQNLDLHPDRGVKFFSYGLEFFAYHSESYYYTEDEEGPISFSPFEFVPIPWPLFEFSYRSALQRGFLSGSNRYCLSTFIIPIPGFVLGIEFLYNRIFFTNPPSKASSYFGFGAGAGIGVVYAASPKFCFTFGREFKRGTSHPKKLDVTIVVSPRLFFRGSNHYDVDFTFPARSIAQIKLTYGSGF